MSRRRPARRPRLAALAACALALCITTSPAAAFTPEPPLAVHGRVFRDADGRTVILHGLFAVWKQDPLYPADTDGSGNGPSFTTGDADLVQELGVDAARLTWYWEGLEPTQGTYSSTYLDGVAAAVSKLSERGVYTVLDSHQDQFNRRYGNKPGFPVWASVDGGLPLAPLSTDPAYKNWKFPLGYFHPSTGAAFANLYDPNTMVAGVSLQDAYGNAWKHVVDRFKDDPMVAGYDLINEPFPGNLSEPGYDTSCSGADGCAAYDQNVLEPFQTHVARAIRTVDPLRTVFYEPTFFFNSGTPNGYTTPPADVAPAGLSFHNQCSTRAQYQVAPDPALIAQGHEVCPPQEAKVMHQADDVAARLGGPPLMTEVAGTTDSDAQELNCLFERADAFQTGYTYGLSWSGSNKELRNLHTESAPDGTVPFKEMVVARTYPRAIAGDADSYGFDVRTGHFAMTYTTRADATGPTVIVTPHPQYPGGYHVSVTGGHATSAPDADLLTVVSDGAPGTGVTVTVDPVSPDATVRPTFPACVIDPPPAVVPPPPTETTPTTTLPRPPPPAPAARVSAVVIHGGLRRGRIALRVTCAAGTACFGTLRLTSRDLSPGSRKPLTIYGTAPLRIAAARTTAVSLTLTHATQRLLKRRARVKAWSVVTLTAQKPLSVGRLLLPRR